MPPFIFVLCNRLIWLSFFTILAVVVAVVGENSTKF